MDRRGDRPRSEMTIREEIAARVLAGFAAAPTIPNEMRDVVGLVARWTDALLAELERTAGGEAKP